MDFLFQKVDLSLQNSGPFICEGGSSEPTEPPGYGLGIRRWCKQPLTRNHLVGGSSLTPHVFFILVQRFFHSAPLQRE